MAYATVSELEARWRTLSPLERQRAQVMLDDAAALIDDEPRATDNEAILRMVSCDMVRRAMADDFGLGTESDSMLAQSDAEGGEVRLLRKDRDKLLRGVAVRFVEA